MTAPDGPPPERRLRSSRSPRVAIAVAYTVAAVAVVVAIAVTASSSGSSAPSTTATPTSGPDDAKYYRSEVTGLTPAVEGLDITLQDNGDSITLKNGTGQEAMVLGYAGEPFLRFAADGVSVNTRSLTAQVNEGKAPAKGTGSAVAWRHVADGKEYTWRDYRVRWTARQRPPIVMQDERARHRVFQWAFPMTVADRNVLVQGEVHWTGVRRFSTGQIVLGVIALIVLVALGVGIGVVLWRRRGSLRGSPVTDTPPVTAPVLLGAGGGAAHDDDPYDHRDHHDQPVSPNGRHRP